MFCSGWLACKGLVHCPQSAAPAGRPDEQAVPLPACLPACLPAVGSATLPWSHQRAPASALIGSRPSGSKIGQLPEVGASSHGTSGGGAVTAEGGAGVALTAAGNEDTSQVFEGPCSEQDALAEGSPGDGTTLGVRRQQLTATSRGPFYTPAPPEALIDARECWCWYWSGAEACVCNAWQPWALLLSRCVCASGLGSPATLLAAVGYTDSV